MQLKLKAFGIARDFVGGHEVDFLTRGTTVGELKREILARYPAFGTLRSFRIAVNLEYAFDEAAIREGDEVVLIPPVSGG
jgi:molybdopterin synthase sulfur carrier subunit